MNALSQLATILRKELLDTFRDRRTIFVTLLTAIAAGPLFLALILNMAASQAEKARDLKLPVAGAENAPALIAFLKRQQVTIEAAPADYEKRIRAGDLDVVLAIDAQFEGDVAAGKAGTVRLIYDRSRDRARASIDQAEALLRQYNRLWGTQRLLLRGIAPDVALPLEVETVDLATPQQSGALILFLVAYYGLFAALMGGMASALDATAGERERGSLEPLLATPLAPGTLVAGKWLSVAVFATLVVLLTLTGFYLTLNFAPLPAVGVPFLFGVRELARFLAVLAPLLLLLPAVLLYVGARGRSLKEAQANVSVLLFVVSVLPVVQLFLQKKEPAWILWLPVSGQYTLLGRALRGEAIPPLDWLQSAAAPLALCALALFAVARLLNRETALASR
ncbi:MAG TPA: ABC transporter permease [Casimicrobiaceae bacterium]|nr:ABC transporter permease [Casimicrobiaceae bacterium]